MLRTSVIGVMVGTVVAQPPPQGGGAPPGESQVDFSGEGPWAAPLLGDVGQTVIAGKVTENVASEISLPVGENIYGPFEAGFSSQQDNILAGLGCTSGKGYVDGGIDTHTAEQIVSASCGVDLPRIENGVRIGMLDSCGGHTKEYHFHERLRCLYTDEAGSGHSIMVGRGLDGRGMYGKWENFAQDSKPLLDACGGHWGSTPESPDKQVYHYHLQDQAPFTLGCYGPNPDNSLVSLAECRKLYTEAGKGCDSQKKTLTLKDSTVSYDDWCPCFDADGSNTASKTLAALNDPSLKAGPGKDYAEPTVAVDKSMFSAGEQVGASTMAVLAGAVLCLAMME